MGAKYNNPEYIGKQYGYLTVIGIEHDEKRKIYMWRCQCKCLKEILVNPYKVAVSKEIKSCGCYRSSSKTGLSKREYHTQYMKKYRDWMKTKCMCVRCGRKDAYTMNGHRYCFECCEKRRKTPFDAIKIEKEEIPKIPKSEWNSYGLCCVCGKRPVKKGIRPYANVPYKTCENCYQNCLKMREGYKRKYGENIRYIYPPHDNTPKAIETYQNLLNDQKERRRIMDKNAREVAEVKRESP